MAAQVTSADGDFRQKLWIWSCCTSFSLDLCPLTVSDYYDLSLALCMPLEAFISLYKHQNGDSGYFSNGYEYGHVIVHSSWIFVY